MEMFKHYPKYEHSLKSSAVEPADDLGYTSDSYSPVDNKYQVYEINHQKWTLYIRETTMPSQVPTIISYSVHEILQPMSSRHFQIPSSDPLASFAPHVPEA